MGAALLDDTPPDWVGSPKAKVAEAVELGAGAATMDGVVPLAAAGEPKLKPALEA